MRLRLLAITAALSMLAACGGGGGGSSFASDVPPATNTTSPVSTPGPVVTPTPIATTGPTPTSNPITPPPVQTPEPTSTPATPAPGASPTPAAIAGNSGAQAQAAQSVLSTMSGSALLGNAGGVGALISGLPGTNFHNNLSRFAAGGGGSSSGGGCDNGRIMAGQPGANATESYVLQGFYDSACTSKEYELDATLVTFENAAGLSVWGQGIQTFYSTTGQVTAMGTLNNIYVGGLGSANEVSNVRETILLTGGLTSAAIGNKCQLSNGSLSCGTGLVTNSTRIGASIGSIISSNFTTPGSLSGATMSVSNVVGALNTLTLTGPGTSAPFYSILGGSAGSPVSISPSAGQIVITDPTNDATTTVTISSTGAVTGVVVETSNGKQVASFSVDAFGVGQITFHNGQQSVIEGYLVQ